MRGHPPPPEQTPLATERCLLPLLRDAPHLTGGPCAGREAAVSSRLEILPWLTSQVRTRRSPVTLVGVYEAKTNLSKLLARVSAGEEIVIARAGRPVARLVAYEQRPAGAKPGGLAGLVELAEDWDSAETNAAIGALMAGAPGTSRMP
ncbi:MAG: type II toxin-antitoxin system Phd/YefM family antitoxin [Candidatus Riflebacteria bacterium]|nr:type II toxin-antitoxin system Phd/YefM family antitoxin [Candidatus Riflebacteria bacterium]